MKKLFIVLAVASLGFVACNNESASEANKDSVTNVIDSTASAQKDTIAKAADSLSNKVDSAASAAKDTLKSK